MKIGNLDFDGYVFGQSGVQGTFGEPDEYPIHKLLRFFPGFSFIGMIFVAKTVTLYERIFPESSNTELVDGYKLKKWFPKSIWIRPGSFLKGFMLNAMGIPNPGLRVILRYKKWQVREDAFQISIALMGKNPKEKVIEAGRICTLLLRYLPPGKYKYALQINDSCPNLGHNQEQDSLSLIRVLKIFKKRLPGLTIILKFDLRVNPLTIVELTPYCDAFCIGNSLPFGKLMPPEWWLKLFPRGSPLLKYFGGKFAGGLSGKPLFPILVDWLTEMEKVDDSVIIIAGGGIMEKKNIRRLSQFKIVHAIALGCVATLRPWRLQSLIAYGNKVFREKTLKFA